MNTEEIDLGSFISHIAAATEEEKYDWRFHSVLGDYIDYNNMPRQLVLLATLGNKDDYSVVEVATRHLYSKKHKKYAPEEVALAISGDNKAGDQVYRQVGLSMAIMHVVEIASLTFYRERILTPIHQMLAEATKVLINFPSPWGHHWSGYTWSKTAYNYGDLISERQMNLTEDQQRRIEGLVLGMLKNRPLAKHWLCDNKHPDFTDLSGWDAVKKFGLNSVEKHLCWIDRSDYESES